MPKNKYLEKSLKAMFTEAVARTIQNCECSDEEKSISGSCSEQRKSHLTVSSVS